jgi:nitroimidazol reductase NimA-like FMN-containing flavoprotein (pyridoxamine 5'-phosphate oxidase superfamily)
MNIDIEHGGTDLGRRILERRRAAGLSREETATRAGMATAYLAYLETSPTPNPTPSALARLADALGTSASALAGASAGQRPSAQRPVAQPLSPAQCRGYLGTGGVGRLVFTEPRGPVALPVNYAVLGGDIVVRTSGRGGLAAHAGRSHVSFEVDQLDDAMAEGWSVLVSGQARVVSAPAELETVRGLGIEPWAGGQRDTYIRIAVNDITGRRIRASA